MDTLAIYSDAFRRLLEDSETTLYLQAAPGAVGQRLQVSEMAAATMLLTGRTEQAEVTSVDPRGSRSVYVTLRVVRTTQP